ncbi:MAG: sulfatase, partial [Proteobacteria bacterium]
LAPAAKPQVAAVAAMERPALPKDLNLLVLTVDTLRYDLGYAGNPRPLSPKLDELAAQSTVFERAYSLASYTGKSIPPLLIGKYPSETLRDGNHFTAFLNPNNVFLAERLKEQGFHTFGGSSLWYISPRFGMTQGFDTWDTSTQSPGAGDKDNSVTSDKVTDVAIAQLSKAENVEGRFFAWYHYMDPHAQYVPHSGAPSFEGVTRDRALYDGEVWYSDQQLGRLLDFVAKSSFGDRTVVVVTSDHGEAFSDHGMSWHGRELWESLVRVPLIIKVPGLPPHRVPVKRGHVDLVPTVLDVLGLPAPAAGQLSGQSMLPDLAKTDHFEERDVYVDMPVGPYNELRRALLHGPTPGQKLIHFGGKQYRLFDLAGDPDEAHDLAKDPAVLKPMVDALDQLRAGLVEVDVPPVKRNVD